MFYAELSTQEKRVVVLKILAYAILTEKEAFEYTLERVRENFILTYLENILFFLV